MTRAEAERERILRESFLCRCGRSLCFENGTDGKVRVACYVFAFKLLNDYRHLLEHDEPTAWCDSKDDARQVWLMVKTLKG